MEMAGLQKALNELEQKESHDKVKPCFMNQQQNHIMEWLQIDQGTLSD